MAGDLTRWRRLIEEASIGLPVPFAVAYPFGRPGDRLRVFAKDEKATCVARYRAVDPRLLARLLPGNTLRYDTTELADDMRINGWKGGPGQDIMVYVAPDGQARIGEGNHRLRAALEAGIRGVSVEVRYLNGSDVGHLLWPINLDDPAIRRIED